MAHHDLRGVRSVCRSSAVLGLALIAACEREAVSPGPSPVVSAPPVASVSPAPPAPPLSGLDGYLAAIPAEPPTLSEAITGVVSPDAAVSVARCRQTGWSYRGCAASFPLQGLQWVRWACMHDEKPYDRSVMCNRLARYLFAGIGGPADPTIARALFDRQCQPDRLAYHHNCYAAASTLMFTDEVRAREYIKRACEPSDQSPIGCMRLRSQIESGIRSREVVVRSVTGLGAVAVGDTCKVWLWTSIPGDCEARVVCGETVLYGVHGSSMPCTEDGTAREEMSNQSDGDPVFVLTATTLTLRDDSTGPLGEFTLSAELR